MFAESSLGKQGKRTELGIGLNQRSCYIRVKGIVVEVVGRPRVISRS